MKKLLLPVVVAFAMISCQKTNEPQITGEPQEIKLSAGVVKMVGETKAAISGTDFTNGTEIGVYGLKDQADWTSTPYFNNTGTVVADGGVTFTNKVYYPQDDKAVNFYAFYPKGTPTTNPNAAPTVDYDLTKQDDILWATVKTGTLSSHVEDKALAFAHKLAKINFKVKAGTDFAADIKVSSILITETNTAATLAVKLGVLTFATQGELTAFTGEQAIETTETATAFGEIMIQPSVAYNIKVTAGGVDYTTTLTAPTEGQAKTVTLTFLPTEIEVKAAITEWGTPAGEGADLQK